MWLHDMCYQQSHKQRDCILMGYTKIRFSNFNGMTLGPLHELEVFGHVPPGRGLPNMIWPRVLQLVGCLSYRMYDYKILSLGTLLDRVGHKWTITLGCFCILVNWLLLLFVRTVPLVYAARIIGGVGGGISFTVVPVYVAECAEVF